MSLAARVSARRRAFTARVAPAWTEEERRNAWAGLVLSECERAGIVKQGSLYRVMLVVDGKKLRGSATRLDLAILNALDSEHG